MKLVQLLTISRTAEVRAVSVEHENCVKIKLDLLIINITAEGVEKWGTSHGESLGTKPVGSRSSEQ